MDSDECNPTAPDLPVVLAAARPDSWWNPTASSFTQGSEMLRERVKEACIEKLGMKDKVNTSPLEELVLPYIPKDFDKLNENEGCVEIKLVITEVNRQTKKILNTWTVIVDADPRNPSTQNPQEPHFGYTVEIKPADTAATKFTGHVWLPKDPPYYRPWKGFSKTVLSNMKKKGGEDNNGVIWFEMGGERHNQL